MGLHILNCDRVILLLCYFQVTLIFFTHNFQVTFNKKHSLHSESGEHRLRAPPRQETAPDFHVPGAAAAERRPGRQGAAAEQGEGEGGLHHPAGQRSAEMNMHFIKTRKIYQNPRARSCLFR